MNARRLIYFVACGFMCLAAFAVFCTLAARAVPNFVHRGAPWTGGIDAVAPLGVFVSPWSVLAAAMVCGTIFLMFLGAMLFRVVRKRESSRSLTDQEGATLEELWDGLQKMEDRMLNLETILLSRDRERDFESRL